MVVETEFAIRMLASALIGLLLGYTRRRKAAGTRTFALICLGCTIFTMVSVGYDFWGNVDSSRIVAAIISGIGFLGLGVIWKHEGRPIGLTTAAAIWVTASLGVLIGLGMWVPAGIGTILTVLLIFSRGTLEKVGIEAKRKRH